MPRKSRISGLTFLFPLLIVGCTTLPKTFKVSIPAADTTAPSIALDVSINTSGAQWVVATPDYPWSPTTRPSSVSNGDRTVPLVIDGKILVTAGAFDGGGVKEVTIVELDNNATMTDPETNSSQAEDTASGRVAPGNLLNARAVTGIHQLKPMRFRAMAKDYHDVPISSPILTVVPQPLVTLQQEGFESTVGEPVQICATLGRGVTSLRWAHWGERSQDFPSDPNDPRRQHVTDPGRHCFSATPTLATAYHYDVIATGPYDLVYKATATVTVHARPSVTIGSFPRQGPIGQSVRVPVSTSGEVSTLYWYDVDRSSDHHALPNGGGTIPLTREEGTKSYKVAARNSLGVSVERGFVVVGRTPEPSGSSGSSGSSGGSSGAPAGFTDCDGSQAESVQTYAVFAINYLSQCPVEFDIQASSLEKAKRCVSDQLEGRNVVVGPDGLSSHYVALFQPGGYCGVFGPFIADSAAHAVTCAQVTNCNNCSGEDITSAATLPDGSVNNTFLATWCSNH